MTRTILAVGDPIDGIISYRHRLKEHSNFLVNNGVTFETLDYVDIESNNLAQIDSDEILAILFFTQIYRNNNIDTWIKKDGIFGGDTHIGEIDKYFGTIGDILRKEYGSNLTFLNSPETIMRTRDKRKIKRELIEAGIPTPEPFYPSGAGDLFEILDETAVYIKLPGWGYGQGITRVSKDVCKTNLLWDGHKISPDRRNTPKHPVEISQPEPFLEELLRFNPAVEAEVDYVKIDDLKFDLRLHVVGNPFCGEDSIKVPFWFPRSNNPEEMVTNWCRGGSIRYDAEFRDKIPKNALAAAKENTIAAAKKLEMYWGGLDIMFDKDWIPFILEGQTDCGLPRKDKFDLMLYLAQRLIES